MTDHPNSMENTPTKPVEASETNETGQIIFFDGVCNLCNFFIDFLISHDRMRRYKIASLQGKTAERKVPRDIRANLQSVVLWDNGEVHQGSTAVLLILGGMGGAAQLFKLLLLIPVDIRDRLYKIISDGRYKWFGERRTCRRPTAEEQEVFLP